MHGHGGLHVDVKVVGQHPHAHTTSHAQLAHSHTQAHDAHAHANGQNAHGHGHLLHSFTTPDGKTFQSHGNSATKRAHRPRHLLTPRAVSLPSARVHIHLDVQDMH